MIFREKIEKKDMFFLLAVIAVSTVLIFIPTGFEKPQDHTIRAKGLVLEVDNSDIQDFTIVKQGDQGVTLEILNGKFKGEVVTANNILLGQLELDSIYSVGDKALLTLELDETNSKILHTNVVDFYRINIELILLVLFVTLLIIYAGWTGVKAVFSFGFTALLIWKVLLPGFLKDFNPIFLSLGIVLALTGAIVFLVGGLNRKGLVAFLGAAAGVILTMSLSLLFGKLFRVHGAVKQFSGTLLYSGFAHINLTQIFLSGIFLASSGAVMDIAMDVSASMREVADKHPDITPVELIKSGFSVGRAVVGTMTTTLLLAYSGGYTALLMVFMAQGTPTVNIFNLTYVSSEILHTLVGSFGLVTVAPFTALIGGLLQKKSEK
jgi:uncharacterized membrane protein